MGRRDVHLEVEVKYDLEPGATAAELLAPFDVEGVDEVRDGGIQRLTATYYDTPELDLLRHRVTLRRRTGGTDAGWHLKLPAGQSGAGTEQGRLEVRRPAGHSRAPVPAELMGWSPAARSRSPRAARSPPTSPAPERRNGPPGPGAST